MTPRLGALAAAVLALAGCAAPPGAMDGLPAVELPARWAQAGAAAGEAAADADGVTRDWWRGFGSAELDALVEQARRHSLDVAAAVARVRQAEASARQAGAVLLPEVTASVQSGRQGRLGGSADVAGTGHGVGLAARYEVDFWGANRAARAAAQADWQASAFDRDTVALTVTAGVAATWLQAMALRERAAIAEDHLRNAQRLLRWMESRARAGAATPLELAQQRGLVAAQHRAVAALRQQAGDARTALALLLGQPGIGIAAGAADWHGLREPGIGAGLPSQLLARRPDLARAEAQLAAADADVAAARAALLPSLTLEAGLGTGGHRLRRLLDDPVYSLAAALVAPVFEGGRLAAGADLALARREELLAGYRQAVLAAFADVEVALNATAWLAEQSAAQGEELAQAQRALALAESRYRAGAETLLALLEAQRTLYAAQDAAVQLRLARLQARVSLYRALGGGWSAAAAGAPSSRGGTPATPAPEAACAWAERSAQAR